MGLKQMIDKAMQGEAEAIAALPPVEISGEAHRAYGQLVRKWTGWNNATLRFEDPSPVSPFASCDRVTHVIKANPERLLLNPHRVLLTVNPFRLRQEAALTGALLHEAGHARHSNWIPRSEIAVEEFKHSDDTPVTKAEFTLAKTLEEARIEGIIASEAGTIGAAGLEWTMRASAAHLVPMTNLSANPDQAIIDLITSWALRAGRQLSLQYHIDHSVPTWVGAFTSMMHSAISDHFLDMHGNHGKATADTYTIIETLAEMCRGTVNPKSEMFRADAAHESDTGLFMVDHAKRILHLLFPETPPDQMPQSGGGCGAGNGEGDEASSGVTEMDENGSGEGDSKPEDEGAGTDPGAGTSGGDGDEQGESQTDTESAVAQALKSIEGQCKTETIQQGEASAKATDQTGGLTGGMGSGAPIGGGWRMPTIEERDVQHNAERFLRDLIDPNPASTIRITDQPSSLIDGAAMAAWKAGGQSKAPRFFKQVKRTVKPTPPVKIAVLVDVSASMEVLQKPSALLSWALASACLDLRNYAGGGVKIESTLIHWGDSARVIQRNGQVLPGIREVGCHDGTTAMDEAYLLIEEQIPDFFEVKDVPENKLIVQFTDWQLASHSRDRASAQVGRGLAAGATLLSIVPDRYSGRGTALTSILAENKIQRGRNHLMRYDTKNPEAVWATAAKVLS